MSSKNKHIDEQFTNYAWKEMSKLLDKELPVKKTRKRFFWAWFAGLVLFVVFGLGYYLGQSSNAIAAFPIKTESVVKNLKELTQNTDNQSTKNEAVASDLNISALQLRSAIPTIKNTAGSKLSSKEEALDGVSSIISPALNNGFKTVKKDLPIATLDQNSLPLKNQILKEPTSILVSFEKLAVLPTLNPLPLYKNPRFLSPKNSLPSISNWAIGLYGDYILQKNSSFRVGLNSRFQFHRRWFLNFGLGYSKLTINTTSTVGSSSILSADGVEISSPVEDTKQEEIASANPMDQDSTTQPMADLVDFTFRHLHSIELPISIQYQMMPNFSLEAGGQIARLLGYHYAQNGATFYTTQGSPQVENINLSLSSTPFSTWQFSAFGGVNYAITPNLQLNARYHLGLNNYYQLEEPHKKWSYGTIGLGIWF